MTTREEFNEEVYSIRANVGGHGNTKWSLECIIDYADTLEEELKALQQPKSCEGCKYGVFESKIKYVSVMDEQIECCLVCVRNCNDYFEPKE